MKLFTEGELPSAENSQTAETNYLKAWKREEQTLHRQRWANWERKRFSDNLLQAQNQ